MKSIIGYSEADFKTLITDKSLYIDRTAFIQNMENQSNKNLVFVRPRRFGKSLWLSILHYYYGAEHKDMFETLFGNLAIGQNPTPLRNTFLVLRFQFAGIDVRTDATTFNGFRSNVIRGIVKCMTAYSSYFSEANKAEIKALETPADIMQTFLSLYESNKVPYPIYILIDEYDQFANELLTTDTERFKAIIGSTGYVRKYYELIKNAANEGLVNRFFATGVSPLTIDAMTSGFNISTSLSLELQFHNLMGFTQAEVAFILKQVGAKEEDIPTIIIALKEWYDGYLFNEEATEHLYNSDMIMYFASHYEEKKKYPRKMLDANIATDYKKVRNIFTHYQQEDEFIAILDELNTEGVLLGRIQECIDVEDTLSEDDIISLLFYQGWITIKSIYEGLHVFHIPNQMSYSNIQRLKDNIVVSLN
jgi:Predicted AAA-ATPase